MSTEKWDRLSGIYDFIMAGERLRLEPYKRRLYREASGRVLIVGCGTGADFHLLPRGLRVVAIDASERMVVRASSRTSGYLGELSVRTMDVERLDFEDASFDTALASCVFCSVLSPGAGLVELRRVLKPSGRLLLVEHVRSRIGPFGLMQDLCTLVSRAFGPSMNRDTVSNVIKAGFEIVREENLHLDVVKWIEARPAQ